jgi:hypothetical protein
MAHLTIKTTIDENDIFMSVTTTSLISFDAIELSLLKAIGLKCKFCIAGVHTISERNRSAVTVKSESRPAEKTVLHLQRMPLGSDRECRTCVPLHKPSE